MYAEPRFLPAGDRALAVELGDDITPETNAAVRDLFVALEANPIPGVVDLVPSYRSVLVNYDPLVLDFAQLHEKLTALLASVSAGEPATPRCVQIPVLYGGDGGPDLDHVANHNNLTVDEVVSIHSGPQYLVYMLGFSPGFPYLGGMDERIETPRLDTPRTIIPAGSVGIAEKQTGVYPTATPGGWQIIGLTPLNFFDPYADPPSLLEPGDLIRFVPIEQQEFDAIAQEVEQGVYQTRTEDPE